MAPDFTRTLHRFFGAGTVRADLSLGPPFALTPRVTRAIDEEGVERTVTVADVAVAELPAAEPVFEPVAVAELPAIAKSRLDVADGPDAEYVALAKSLGMDLPVFLQADLEGFLAANFIEVYSMDAVNVYMNTVLDREAGLPGLRRRRAYMYWFWRPLREIDRIVAERGGRGKCATNSPVMLGDEPHGDYSPNVHAIPFPVLQTVKLLADRFGDSVAFFVSDYASKTPDPFLMVTAAGCPGYVIERWDEPGFRG